MRGVTCCARARGRKQQSAIFSATSCILDTRSGCGGQPSPTKKQTRIDRPESEQCLVKNTHQPLVSQEQWEIVQEVRQHKSARRSTWMSRTFSPGLVFCADCGKPLVLHRASTMKKVEYNFKCYTYGKKGKTACTAHHIRECELTQIVLMISVGLRISPA